MDREEKKKLLWYWIRDVVLPVGLCYLIFFRIFGVAIVFGQSMFPKYETGDIVFIHRLDRKSPERGEIVVLDADYANAEKRLIKRVIAIAGDTLDISPDGSVILNGVHIDEPYAIKPTSPGTDQIYPVKVPDGYVFVMGDNRPESIDSRSRYGLVPVTSIIGIVYGGT